MSRIQLTSTLNLYVAATGGSNSNDGLYPGSPFATINHAIDVACNNYDLNGQQLNINLAPDSVNKYAAVVLKNFMDAGVAAQSTNPRIIGDPAYPELYQIQGGASDPAAILAVGVAATWLIEGVQVSHTSGLYGIEADFYSKLYLRTVNFGVCGVHATAVFGSCIEFLDNGSYPLCKIVGSAASFIMANIKGMFIFQTGSIVFSGTPSLTYAFAMSQNQSFIYFGASCSGSLNNNKTYICEYSSGIQGYPAMPAGNVASTLLNYSYAN